VQGVIPTVRTLVSKKYFCDVRCCHLHHLWCWWSQIPSAGSGRLWTPTGLVMRKCMNERFTLRPSIKPSPLLLWSRYCHSWKQVTLYIRFTLRVSFGSNPVWGHCISVAVLKVQNIYRTGTSEYAVGIWQVTHSWVVRTTVSLLSLHKAIK